MKKEFHGCSWRMSDRFWIDCVVPLLPKYASSLYGGRPRADLLKVSGIFAANGLPMEGTATSVWQRQHSSSLLSRMDAARRVSLVVAAGAEALRSSPTHCVDLADPRRFDGQGFAGREKKPEEIRPIVVSSASNGRFLPMAEVCRSAWPLPPQKRAIKNSFMRLWPASRSPGPDPPVGIVIISAAIWDTTVRCCGEMPAGAATLPTFIRGAMKETSHEYAANELAAGSSSVRRRA